MNKFKKILVAFAILSFGGYLITMMVYIGVGDIYKNDKLYELGNNMFKWMLMTLVVLGLSGFTIGGTLKVLGFFPTKNELSPESKTSE